MIMPPRKPDPTQDHLLAELAATRQRASRVDQLEQSLEQARVVYVSPNIKRIGSSAEEFLDRRASFKGIVLPHDVQRPPALWFVNP